MSHTTVIADGMVSKRKYVFRQTLPAPFSCKGSGIYGILNEATGKIYIGSAVRLNHRWTEHRGQLENGTHGNRYLQRAFDKNPEAFQIELIEELNFPDKEKLLSREQFWIDFYRSWLPENGYNISPKAESCQGIKRDPEFVARVSKSLTGFKHSAKSRANMAASQRGRTKKKRDSANKTLMRMLGWGRKWTVQQREKRKLWMETNRKVCGSHPGRPVVQVLDTGEIVNKFPSIADAAEHLSIKECGIRAALHHPNWHAGGFKWRDA